jgi:predicted GH43/DUF377 family glycosyl hydrolase
MKWKKLGHIFDPTTWNDGIDRSWMKTHSQCTHALVLDNVVRIYFSCRPENDENGFAKSYTTFLDLDKNNLTKIIQVSDKPVMPLGELGTFDEFAVYPSCNIKHEDKILFYYVGWTRCQSVPFNTSIGLAISEDNGETFNQNIISDILDENECQAGPDVFYKDGLYHMYFAYREGLDFRNIPGRGYKIGYATSTDLINWERKDKEAGIEYSETGWDSTMHHYPHVFEVNGTHYMTFNGNDFGKYGFGLAILEQ